MRESSSARHSSILRRLAVGFPTHWPRRKEWAGGFTLIELLLVLAVMGILTLMGMHAYAHFINKAKNTRAIAELRLLDKEIIGFLQSNGRLPDSLVEIGRESMLDPWKHGYRYLNFEITAAASEVWRTKGSKSKGKGKGKGLDKSESLNSDYDLYSMGRDGMSLPTLEDETSKDDIIRAADGSYIGLAAEYN